MATGRREQNALIAFGIALLVLAAIFTGATGVAFAAVGALIVVFGIVRTSLEGQVKVGPSGFEGTFSTSELTAEIERQGVAEGLPPERIELLIDVTEKLSARIDEIERTGARHVPDAPMTGGQKMSRETDLAQQVVHASRRHPVDLWTRSAILDATDGYLREMLMHDPPMAESLDRLSTYLKEHPEVVRQVAESADPSLKWSESRE